MVERKSDAQVKMRRTETERGLEREKRCFPERERESKSGKTSE